MNSILNNFEFALTGKIFLRKKWKFPTKRLKKYEKFKWWAYADIANFVHNSVKRRQLPGCGERKRKQMKRNEIFVQDNNVCGEVMSVQLKCERSQVPCKNKGCLFLLLPQRLVKGKDQG